MKIKENLFMMCGDGGGGGGGPGASGFGGLGAEIGTEGETTTDFGVANEGSLFGGQDPDDFGGIGPDPGVEAAQMSALQAAEENPQIDMEATAGWITTTAKVVYGALVAFATLTSPLVGGALALLSPLAKKGAEEMAAHIAQELAKDPNLSVDQAVSQELDARGNVVFGPGYDREQVTEYVTNTIGEQNPIPDQTESPDTSALSDEERALLDQMEQNQIQKFTDQVMERAEELNQMAIADLVGRGVLESSRGEKVLADLNEQALENIRLGTIDIQTKRMETELELIQSAGQLDWERQRWGEEADLQKYLTEFEWEKREDIEDENRMWNTFGNVMGGTIAGLWGSGDSTDWSQYFG